MADYARLVYDAGANIIGGCCGTTPEHIAVMRDALDNHQRAAPADMQILENVLGPVTTGAKAQLGGDLSVSGGSLSGGARERRPRRSRK